MDVSPSAKKSSNAKAAFKKEDLVWHSVQAEMGDLDRIVSVNYATTPENKIMPFCVVFHVSQVSNRDLTKKETNEMSAGKDLCDLALPFKSCCHGHPHDVRFFVCCSTFVYICFLLYNNMLHNCTFCYILRSTFEMSCPNKLMRTDARTRSCSPTTL